MSMHTVIIDVEEEKPAAEKDVKMSREDRLFSDLVVSQMTREDFSFLYGVNFNAKNHITKDTAPEDIHAYFEYDQIEKEGLMTVYSDVLPYADTLSCKIGSEVFLIIDHYCLMSKCSCHNVMLTFLSMDESGKPIKSKGSISVDYMKKKWKDVKEDFSSISLETVKSAVMEQIPDLWQVLSDRHRQLKKIYAHCRKRYIRDHAPARQRKIGRNEPCPCGSGKKYKKCCMNKKQQVTESLPPFQGQS